MNREKNLVKNMAILSVGTVLPKLCSFITLPILTSYLTKSDYGSYDLISTLVSLLLPAVTLQAQSAGFRFLINQRGDEDRINTIISTLVYFTIFVSVPCLGISYLCLYRFSRVLRLEIAIYFFSDIIQVSVGQIARGLGKNVLYSISSVIHSIVNVLFIVIMIRLTKKGLEGLIFSLIISSLIGTVFLVCSLKLWKRTKKQFFSTNQLKRMLSYSWPMVPNSLSGWILSVSDRLVITTFLGVEANAVYAVANKIPNLLQIFQSTFAFAWQENASLTVNESDSAEYYSKMFDTMFCLISAGCAGLLIIMPLLFRLFIKGEYADAYTQMPILLLGLMFNCISLFIGGIYIAHMKTKSVGVTTAIAAILNLIIDLLFINKIGIYAGSISTMISYAILMIYRMVNVTKFQKISYSYFKITLIITLLIIMVFLSIQTIRFYNLINIVLGIIIIIVFNKSLILSIIKITKSNIKKY